MRTPFRDRAISFLLVLLFTTACGTSPLGRRQVLFLPAGQVDAMGVQSFTEMKKQTPSEPDPTLNAYIKCITDPLTSAARGQVDIEHWEVVVFKDKTANAFALPGGKIGVHTGILPVAKTDGQLAAVLGHEIGHVISHHGQERMSQSVLTQIGLAGVDLFLAGRMQNPTQKGLIMAALGTGANVGYMLPHSREQESEADLVGLDLMARAGFDPHQSLDLWKNMAAAAGGKAPAEFLSTHPANQTRLDALQTNMTAADSKYQAAKAGGGAHSCVRPSGW